LSSYGKKYLCIKWFSLTSKKYAKYVGSVPKGRKKREAR